MVERRPSSRDTVARQSSSLSARSVDGVLEIRSAISGRAAGSGPKSEHFVKLLIHGHFTAPTQEGKKLTVVQARSRSRDVLDLFHERIYADRRLMPQIHLRQLQGDSAAS
eukprot:scaffold143_cov260-Pinguiococcus_pyrenoidosus.AAC.22